MAEEELHSLTACSGRVEELDPSGPWWAEIGARLADTPVRLRLGCSTPAGELWISVPLRRRRQQQRSRGPGRPATSAQASLGLSRIETWQTKLLDRLLADPEVQMQLQKAGLTLGEETIARWAKAKQNRQEVVEELLRAHIQWRADEIPGGNIHEDQIANELADQKVFLQGCDTKGRAVVVVHGRLHFTSKRVLEESIRLICYVLDNAIAATETRRNPASQIICLFDLGGLRMRNLDVAALRAIFDLVQFHYPEHLAMLWFLNAPFIFRGAWRGISPFIQPSTREKIEFLNGDHGSHVLQSNISSEVLPTMYGGTADLVPVEVAVARQRRQSQALTAKSASVAASAPGIAKDRASAAGRAVKRWGGAALGFVRRHNPGPPVAKAARSWFAHKPGQPASPGRIRTSMSRMSRALSTRLSMTTPRSLASPRNAQSILRGLTQLTPAAVASMVVVALRSLSVTAAQALHWAWERMQGRPRPVPPTRSALRSHMLQLNGLTPIQESSEQLSSHNLPETQTEARKVFRSASDSSLHQRKHRAGDRPLRQSAEFPRASSHNQGARVNQAGDDVLRLDMSQLLKGSFGFPSDIS